MNNNKSWIALGVVGLIIYGVWYAGNQPKSNAEKAAQCSTDAITEHDGERRTITTNANGYSPSEQQYYYQQTDNGLTRQLAACRQEYPN